WNLGKRKIVPQRKVPLGRAGETLRAPIRDDLLLYISGVGGHQADALRGQALQEIAIGEYGRASPDAGRGRDTLAQTLVAIETEPARGGAIPGNDVDLGMREKFRRAQDFR